MKKAVIVIVVVLASVFLWAPTAGATGTHLKTQICHRDQGSPEWKQIEISISAVWAHTHHQWGEDIWPVPENGCPVQPDDETRQTVEEGEPNCEEGTVEIVTTNYRTPYVWDDGGYVLGDEVQDGDPIVTYRDATEEECPTPPPEPKHITIEGDPTFTQACGVDTVYVTVTDVEGATWTTFPGGPVASPFPAKVPSTHTIIYTADEGYVIDGQSEFKVVVPESEVCPVTSSTTTVAPVADQRDSGTPSDGGSGDTLPVTGAMTLPLVGLGLALIAGGRKLVKIGRAA